MSPLLEVVLDTNVVVSLSRKPTTPPNDAVSKAIEKRQLTVCVDEGKGIVSEWEQTAKLDVVRQLITHWIDNKGWKLVILTQDLPRQVKRELRQLCFADTVDKLVLRTSYNTTDKRVVTNDPDFWDPLNRTIMGEDNAPVAKLCREELDIEITTLLELVNKIT